MLELFHRDEVIYSCNPPFECHMQGVWDAYCKTLKSRKDEIAALKKEIEKKDELIHELEVQVSRYKEKLEKIKSEGQWSHDFCPPINQNYLVSYETNNGLVRLTELRA